MWMTTSEIEYLRGNYKVPKMFEGTERSYQEDVITYT